MKRRSRDGVFTRPGRSGFYITFNNADGVRVRRKVQASTVQEARDLLAAERARVEKVRTLGYTPPSQISFAEASERFLAHQRPRLCASGYERCRGIVEDHLKPFFAGELRSVTRASVNRFVTARSAEMSPSSVIKELNVLKRMLRLCEEEWELIPVNPSRGVRPPRAPAGRLRYLQPTELRALLEACPEWLRVVVAIAVATGMRRGEILKLRWLDVDFTNNRILLPQTKNGEGRIVYLNKMAQAALRSVPFTAETKPKDLLFPNLNGPQVSMHFARVCRRLAIPDFRFHDLRHTTASWLRMKGADVHTVAQVLGHKDLRMAIRYQHLSPEFLAQAVGRLDEAFGDRVCPQGVTTLGVLTSEVAASA
jgi:integrase